MRIKIMLLVILLSINAFIDSIAQEIPLVYKVENTGANCPATTLFTLNELPSIDHLPDPFEWSNGSGRITGIKDWQCRRAEIGTEIQHYEIGTKPAPPRNLQAKFSQEGILTVIIVEKNDTLKLTSKITLPKGNGPFPAVIGIGGGTGSLPPDIFITRGIATIQFNFGEVMAWKPRRGKEPFNRLYPDSTVGSFVAWAWGISRIIDGLEKVPEIKIDLRHLALSGCSFAGKIALYAGAFDERIALTISQESGGGGAAAWRVTDALPGKRETLRNAQGVPWYAQDLTLFNEAVRKLPFDHHELMAIVAPRSLLILGNPDYEWLADESGYVSCMAAKEVWKAFGIPDRFGFSIVAGHGHCQLPDSQRPEVIAFVEKFLLGDTTINTNISTSPYHTDLSRWISW
jgi:hypothetical protein